MISVEAYIYGVELGKVVFWGVRNPHPLCTNGSVNLKLQLGATRFVNFAHSDLGLNRLFCISSCLFFPPCGQDNLLHCKKKSCKFNNKILAAILPTNYRKNCNLL